MSSSDFPACIAVPASSIEDVIDQLGAIVAWSKASNSRLGYFAALYRKVTLRVKQGIDNGEFEDGPRMERLDVIFANRYIEALHKHLCDQLPTACWVQAFETADCWRPVVLQHLLLGMNAHINLDLGIAAAETVPAEQMPALKADFERINDLLASLVDGVQEELAEIWAPMRLANRYLATPAQGVINFSMQKARDEAWDFACQLAPLDERGRLHVIDDRDWWVADISRLIRCPGLKLSAILLEVRAGERGSIAEQIQILE